MVQDEPAGETAGPPVATGSLDAYWGAALALSRRLPGADGRDLDAVLDAIVEGARAATGADAIAVVRASDTGRPWLAAAHGLPDAYTAFLHSRLPHTDTVAGRVIGARRSLVIADIATDAVYDAPSFDGAREQAAAAGFRALLTVPLAITPGDAPLGALDLYRRDAHRWRPEEIALAEGLAGHAAAALSLTLTGAEHRREVETLRRVCGALRQESHEYANRLQALSGLLELGDSATARRFLDELVALHHEGVASVVRRIRPPTLAGLLMVQIAMADDRGVLLELDAESHLEALPAHVADAAAVTIVGNLLMNAIDAAAMMADPRRRRVVVHASEAEDHVTVAVRDWGAGIAPEDEENLTTPGFSRKAGHGGLGLALLSDRVATAGGAFTVVRHAEGVSFEVRLPLAPPAGARDAGRA